MKAPSTKATKAMPVAIRIACMSLVALAMMSPAALPWKYDVGRVISLANSLSLRAVSMRLEAPCMK